jgi:hypothetical protein
MKSSNDLPFVGARDRRVQLLIDVRKGPRQKRFSIASDVSQAVKAAQEGGFASLFENDTENWWAFVRERLDLGAKKLMIRIDLEDASLTPWYLWLLFSAQEHGRALSLKGALVPDYENEPDAALETPKGREQVPYFVLS